MGYQNFSATERPGGAEPLNVGPPIIWETTGARKLKLKTQSDVAKYSLRVQYFFPLRWTFGRIQWHVIPESRTTLQDEVITSAILKIVFCRIFF